MLLSCHIVGPVSSSNDTSTVHGLDCALNSSHLIEHRRQQSSPPVTLYSPGRSCVAAIMSLAVTMLAYILSDGKQERVQRPHLNQAASTALVCVGSYACSLSRSPTTWKPRR